MVAAPGGPFWGEGSPQGKDGLSLGPWKLGSSLLLLWVHPQGNTMGARCAYIDMPWLHRLRSGYWAVLWGILGDHQLLKTKRV